MSQRLAALKASAQHLADVVAGRDAQAWTTPAYPQEWTVADTLSHLGSGAVISQRRLLDVLSGEDGDPAFAQSVWDTWNAKTPEEQVSDALTADRAFVERLEEVGADERAGFRFQMGPFDTDFEGFLGMRLNEHALHTWDVEVAFDPTAVLLPITVPHVLTNLEIPVRFGGRPIAEARTVRVRTTSPAAVFQLTLGPGPVAMEVAQDGAGQDGAGQDAAADQEGERPDGDPVLPAEAFVRLLCGRLDPEHSPIPDTADLVLLRSVFPGF